MPVQAARRRLQALLALRVPECLHKEAVGGGLQEQGAGQLAELVEVMGCRRIPECMREAQE